MNVIIIGGGITGMTAGYELMKRGHRITLFEKEPQIGGLAGSFRLGDIWLEKFYHHIFKNDIAIIDLINEMGLGEDLMWRCSPMGFFHKGMIYRFGTPLDLLRFSPLSFKDRMKLGLAVLHFKRMEDWQKLDEVSCEEWFTRHASPATYRVVWEPLLRLKFGDAFSQIPASWIWGRIHPRARSRSKGGMKEELGYLKGGFQRMIERMRKEIVDRGGAVIENTSVDHIIREENRVRGIVAGDNEYFSDVVVSTVAIPAFLQIAPQLPGEYISKLKGIDYQAVVCLVMESSESLSPIYWLNISDPGITFGGVIEQTNFVSPKHYGGKNIIYIFNYVNESHPYFRMNREAYFEHHEPSLKRINPSFDRHWIKNMHLFRANYGTVIYTLGYREKLPSFTTPLRGLYMANTSQIYPYDRNMNNCAVIGQRVAKRIQNA
jgi:protoporphyrinogen oxidase